VTFCPEPPWKMNKRFAKTWDNQKYNKHEKEKVQNKNKCNPDVQTDTQIDKKTYAQTEN
jgi:hypothetical protein